VLPIKIALWITSFVALSGATVSDLKRRIVPNPLVLVLAAGGTGLHLLADPRTLWASLAAALAILFLLGQLARRGIVGGGDAKLIAAASLLVLPGQVVTLLLEIAIAGGVLSLIFMVKGAAPQPVAGPSTGSRSATLPYSPAVLGGTLFFALTEAIRCHSAMSCSL
jgi:prepilin peptidase CpaA